MNIEDFNTIEYLITLNEADMSEKDQCERIIRTYIDGGYKLCKTCDPQVVAGFKRLRKWWEINRTTYLNSTETKKNKKK